MPASERSTASVVCFTGVDGAGKTTLARAVVRELRRRGYRATYSYGRYQPVIAREAVNVSSREWKETRGLATLKTETRGRYLAGKHPVLFAILRLVILLDYVIFSVPRICRPMKKGTIVVVDRYYWDTLIADFQIGVLRSARWLRVLSSVLSSLSARPDLVFYMHVPDRIALQRKDDIHTLASVAEWKRTFEAYFHGRDMITLDGRNNPEELLSNVINLLLVNGLIHAG